ncbi:unnamed protein product [Darwinula stevensoni]|uniref:OmpA-like domain-containing protein n=1 Tax=Darwinula stevensoni TaxID=69355 RepID=A0A7R8XE42_9CRUS|nr:unnamed protein product [Darwinula stevensoni]CAG0894097.1 unnamed protein product [Darwinula stevensoni]
MKVEWYGETKPVADNSSEEGKQRNRRVEVKVLDAKLENMSRPSPAPSAPAVPKAAEVKKPAATAPTAPKVETPAPKKVEVKTPAESTETGSDVPKKTPQEELNENANNLHQLKTAGRAEAGAALAEAREKGDLSENAEYDAAKEEQAKLEKRIAQLEMAMTNVRILDEKEIDDSKEKQT